MSPLAFIKFVDPRSGPVDPGFGNEGGGGHPDNGLPGDPIYGGGHPDNGLPWAPVRPDGSPILPPRPWPPLPFPPKDFPPGPTDPDWGVGGGPPTHPTQPIYLPPDQIDNELPPVAGVEPPTDPPPGTIWPPIAGLPGGKCALLAWFYRLGWRYVVVDASLAPGNELPGGPPPIAGHPLPPTPTPPPETGTLGAYLDTVATVVNLKAASKAVAGTNLKIGVEYMTVTDAADPSNLKVTRGTAGTIEVHPAGVSVEIGVKLPPSAGTKPIAPPPATPK